MPLVIRRPLYSTSIRSFLRPITHLVRELTPHHPPAKIRSPHASHSTTRTQGEDVVHELGARVARSLETCKNRNLFANDDSWRRRTHACIETTTTLVCCANGGMDQLFVMRWTCLTCG
jgi:hypothetical protein